MITDPYLMVTVLTAIVILGLGVTVLARDYSRRLNRAFFTVCCGFAVWIPTNYLSNLQTLSTDVLMIINHLTLLFGSATVFCILWFSVIISNQNFDNKVGKEFRWLLMLGAISSLSALTPFVLTGISRQGDVNAVQFGHLAAFYFVSILIGVVAIFIKLLQGIISTTGASRERGKLIVYSLSATIAFAVFTNVILPTFFNNFALTNLGPLGSVFFIVGLAYAIARHRLFDIRLVIARTLAYLLSVALVCFVYVVATVGILNGFVLVDSPLSIRQSLTFALLAVLLAFVFQPIKRTFDRVTNKFFYKDIYDAQLVLDRTSNLLIESLNVDEVLARLRLFLMDQLKLEWIVLVICPENGRERVIPFEVSKHNRLLSDTRTMLNVTKHQSLTFNALEQNSVEEKLMSRHSMQFCAALVVNEKLVGYVMAGEKKSGVAYSAGDAKLLDIISSQVALCIQNALRFEEIQNFNITLQQRVNDATRQLRRTNAKLEALDETKDDFISMASHQLRTPLTSVKGYLSMVLEGDGGKLTPLQRKMLDQAFMSSQRMVFLIADLLNVSRLKTGKFIIEPMRLSLVRLVQDEVDQLKPTAEAHGLELTFEAPDKAFPEVMLDETKTRQVVMNFIDNAIFYTQSGGHVTVKLLETSGSIELRVVDDGIGVPKAEQPHLFTKFYRAGNARRKRPDGTGLGLFMAKKVVVAQGGAVVMDSKEGKGSTFGFIFPKAKIAAKPVVAPAKAVDKH